MRLRFAALALPVAVAMATAAGGGGAQSASLPADAARSATSKAGAARAAPGPRLAAYPWGRRVRKAIRYARRRSGQVSFAVVDERKRLRGWHRKRRYSSASVVKVMLLVAYLRRGGVKRRGLHRDERRLLKPMIRRSDNDAASRVYSIVGSRGLNGVAKAAGMRRFSPDPVWGGSQITARDQARFMRRVDRFVSRRHRPIVLHLLRKIVPSQRWGMPKGLPAGWRIHFKGGWVPSIGRIHQVALLRRPPVRPGKPWRRLSVAVLTEGSPSLDYGAKTIQGVTARLLYRYTRITAPASGP